MHQFLVSAAAFIVLVGILVVIHELGHFTVAKLCGVRVEAFSVGFGPRLFGFKYGDTEYKVCLLPLGGFVKMTGENPEQNLEAGEAPAETIKDDSGALTAHPRWQRMLIGIAGPVFNFLLALGLMLIYFGFINEVPTATVKNTTVDWIEPGSAAATAGIETGDVILSFDGINHPDWDTVFEHVKLNANQVVPLAVGRAGKTLSLSLHVPASAKSDTFDLTDAGISPQLQPGALVILQVQPGTPAASPRRP